MANNPHHLEQNSHHIIPLPTYLKVFAALITLTAITVLVSRFDLGEWNTIVAFLIATVKAVLVLAIFMHLKYDNMLNRVIIFSAAFFLLVLYFFVTIDDVTRVAQSSTL
jgi:cytochrome c oxidase subunit 4